MALLHRATLSPSKLTLLTGWLPSRPWFTGETPVNALGSYRFDDPAGEVGIQTFLLQADDGPVVQVPLTYRSAPLPGASEFLVGTSEHSVLGLRWVYDACADPVWATALANTVLTGGTQVEEFMDVDGRLEPHETTASVVGSGSTDTPPGEIDAVTCHDEGVTTVVRTDAYELILVRVVGTAISAAHTLTGTWPGGGPAVLAGVRRR